MNLSDMSLLALIVLCVAETITLFKMNSRLQTLRRAIRRSERAERA